ncbi:hypothetical protein, partial [Pedobacter sp.]
MSSNTSYVSRAYNIGELLSSVTWQFGEDKLIRQSKKQKKITYSYKAIESIRLCYHIGSRTTPPQYCCYIRVNGNWSRRQMLGSENAQTATESYRQYHIFVTELIEKVNKHNNSFTLICGHSLSSWSLYFFTCLFLLLLPYIAYQNHIITYKECLWGTVIL